jgi:hypothetical protein
MLTGAFPRDFQAPDPFVAILQNNPIPIRQHNPLISKGLAEAIDLALIEKPEIYFKTAVDFKNALKMVR